MRALVIAPQPFFSPRGTPFSVYYRTLITAELGVQVDLLTYGEGQDSDIPGVRIIRIPRFAWLGPVKTGPSMLKLFLDVFLVAWTVALLIRHRYDFVHAHEEAIFFCRFLKPLFGFKLVYDMHSSLPQQLTNFQFTTSKVLIGTFDRLERSSLHASDAVITICPGLADYALGQLEDADKHFLIENSLFDPVRLAGEPAVNGDATIPAAPPAGVRLVVYAGTLEPYQGIDRLLRAFVKVRHQVPDAFLLVAGGNAAQVAHYRALATELGLADACTFTGSVPPNVAKAYCAKGKVLLSPRTEGVNTPLKVYEQLASGLPLVATNIDAHTQVLDDRVAFLVEPSPEDIARGIVDALTDDAARRAKVAAARALYERKYARPVYVSKMQRLLDRLA